MLRDRIDDYREIIKRVKLQDGTIMQLRKKSKSGGSTIEIGNKKPNQAKIHNKAKEDGDW